MSGPPITYLFTLYSGNQSGNGTVINAGSKSHSRFGCETERLTTATVNTLAGTHDPTNRCEATHTHMQADSCVLSSFGRQTRVYNVSTRRYAEQRHHTVSRKALRAGRRVAVWRFGRVAVRSERVAAPCRIVGCRYGAAHTLQSHARSAWKAWIVLRHPPSPAC